MFGVGFVLAAIGLWLVDSAVQGRKPVDAFKSLIQNPSNPKQTLASHNDEISPGKEVANSLTFWQQLAGPAAGVAGGSNGAGGAVKGHGSVYVSGGRPSGEVSGQAAQSYNQPSSSSVPGRAVAFAKAQVGKPYKWGATGPNAFDCSGLMYAAYKSAGVTIPRTTAAMLASRNMIRVKKANLVAGDIVFPYVGHCFMYIGNGEAVEAPHTGENVHITNMYAFMTARRPHY